MKGDLNTCALVQNESSNQRGSNIELHEASDDNYDDDDDINNNNENENENENENDDYQIKKIKLNNISRFKMVPSRLKA